jgi:hypothetical protein
MSRETTNTPLQALTLLNDPQFVEASRVFAERLLNETPDVDGESILRRAFEIVTSRLPSEVELGELVAAWEEQRSYFERHRSEAKAFLRVGESSRDENLDIVEHAALAVIANLVFNLSEAITKG